MPSPKRPYLWLGRNLLAARDGKGWTQEKAAEECGVSLKYWQSLESGLKAPAFATLCRLRQVLGVPWDELCRGC